LLSRVPRRGKVIAVVGDPTRPSATKPFSRTEAEQPAARRDEEKAWLILYHRDGSRTVEIVRGEPLVVGRTPPADVVIDDPSLSRQHARITLGEANAVVEDLGSTNGTWLGGDSVTKATLRVGEEMAFGAVTAVLHLRGELRSPHLGLEGHDRFVGQLELDVARARFFGRPLAVFMLESAHRGADISLRRWAPALLARLRPVDRAGVYSSDIVEVVLPELGLDAAIKLAEALVATGDDASRLHCGVAVFPDCASSADRLLEAAREALHGGRASQAVVVAESQRQRTFAASGAADVVCASGAMKETLDLARRLGRGVIPVLLHGETGSGKEVVARFIHEHGPRRDKPLLAVNCAALPAQLVESTLFGHEKGAFTGAVQRHVGVFEAASGGTVFLDEIGELPADAQGKLLRVLETKTITRVGSTQEIAIDVRILAASYRDLEAMIADGTFRQDLFYRLNAVTMAVPPLRARIDDIAPLAERFLALANAANGTAVTQIEPEAMAALLRCSWPGNVRELRNAIERAVVIAEDDAVTLDDLPSRVREVAQPPAPSTGERSGDRTLAGCFADEDFRACMERLEQEVLLTSLRETSWNQSAAARRLRMPRRTLVHKIRLYGLKRD
jgi:two-component system, NtrC family, response regulator AtoC